MTKAPVPTVPTKKLVGVKVEGSYLNLDYTSLDDAVKSLQRAKNRYSNEGWLNLRLQYTRDCGCYHSCDCSEKLRLFGDRLETDEEFDKRVAQEEKWAADKLARDRADFERLSQQFGSVQVGSKP